MCKTKRNGSLYRHMVCDDFQEDIKMLIVYIVESFYKQLEGVTYVKTFANLKVRYDQQQERLKDKLSER